MITLKFTVEKTNAQFIIIIPTIALDLSYKAYNTIDIRFGWLNVLFGVSIHWSRN